MGFAERQESARTTHLSARNSERMRLSGRAHTYAFVASFVMHRTWRM
jgi:hypothetical protein